MLARKKLELAKKNNWLICVYGLGTYGTKCSEVFLNYLGLKADLYCDKNLNVLDKFSVEISRKIEIKHLIEIQRDVLVLLFLSSKYQEEVISLLGTNEKLHIITWQQIHELLDEDSLLLNFFRIPSFPSKHDNSLELSGNIKDNKKNGRIAVYTCITNDYDKFYEPTIYDKRCDYFFITDSKEYQSRKYNGKVGMINVYDVIPENIINPKDQNRYCKSHGFEIFSEYSYSIYFDGSIEIIGNIGDYISYIGEYGIALHRHPFCEDAYMEMFSMVIRDRIDEEDALATAKQFSENGLYRKYGMAECGIIVSDHRNFFTNLVLTRWYKVYSEGKIKRDQIYMSYVLWELGIKIEDICTLPGYIRKSDYLKLIESHCCK